MCLCVRAVVAVLESAACIRVVRDKTLESCMLPTVFYSFAGVDGSRLVICKPLGVCVNAASLKS
jgi:hypothetical protein